MVKRKIEQLEIVSRRISRFRGIKCSIDHIISSVRLENTKLINR